jgi:endonuclease-8
MPEGHTIHRAARDQEEDLGGEVVRVTSPQGRVEVQKLVDASGEARLQSIEAYGKHLFYRFHRGRIVHVHLGLFGKFYRKKTPAPLPRPTTRMRLEGRAITIDLVGPTACDVITAKQRAEIVDRLGPDPLREDADPEAFYTYLERSKTPIAAALLDQSIIAGVGNVYRAEVLHLLKLHPLTACRDIPKPKRRAMWKLIAGLLRRGVEDKRIITTRGLSPPKSGERITRAESVHVYGRPTCRTCGAATTSLALRARTAYYCRTCQPLPEPPL